MYGSVVLRPTRIAFMVRPNQESHAKVREFIRACTCLWGGMFNPIIPVSNVLPAAWRQGHFREITGRGLADAYVRFFEPDVFVEAEPGLAKEAGISDAKHSRSERVVSLKQFVRSGEGRHRSDFSSGLSALDIYRDVYERELKFTSRHPPKIVAFAEANPFFEAVFGDFPLAKEISYFKKAFLTLCEPEILAPTAENCAKIFRERCLTPS